MLGLKLRPEFQGKRIKGTVIELSNENRTVDLPWKDCLDLIDSSPLWVLWHHWPDQRLHSLQGPGASLSTLAKDGASQLTSEDFWSLIQRMTTGRRLVITSDHGYGASGLFPDVTEADQVDYLRDRFHSGRFADAKEEPPGPWGPPLDLTLSTRQGRHAFVLGRRKWKIPGGYPTLTHGGLSLLEVAVPFLEISR